VSDTDKIYVDASQPAILQHAGASIDCLTLAEAVIAWYRLPTEQRQTATIKIRDGTLYRAAEIERLRYGPRPLAE